MLNTARAFFQACWLQTLYYEKKISLNFKSCLTMFMRTSFLVSFDGVPGSCRILWDMWKTVGKQCEWNKDYSQQ